MKTTVGFMQGRLSPLVNGKIQAFPWTHWRAEFRSAEQHGFTLMEWTLDQERLYENPLMTLEGQREIQDLSQTHGVQVGSLTGDCFMQAPFYKADGKERRQLLDDARRVVEACFSIGIRYVVIPLVDNGRLENERQEDALRQGLESLIGALHGGKVRIVFESDFEPARLREFIDSLPQQYFGINYDIGNSASLGFDPREEIPGYAHRIYNVHVKDRKLGGTTVPLGTGHADLPAAFQLLRRHGYRGNYILQTARATDDNHAGVLCRYRDMVKQWLGADAG